MQNEMRERQMAMQIAWSREFLKYFGSFFGLAAFGLTARSVCLTHSFTHTNMRTHTPWQTPYITDFIHELYELFSHVHKISTNNPEWPYRIWVNKVNRSFTTRKFENLCQSRYSDQFLILLEISVHDGQHDANAKSSA